MLRPGITRRIAILAILIASSIIALLVSGPNRHEITTQRPGEPKRVWRSMRTVWTFQPGIHGYHGKISDLLRQRLSGV